MLHLPAICSGDKRSRSICATNSKRSLPGNSFCFRSTHLTAGLHLLLGHAGQCRLQASRCAQLRLMVEGIG
jgi:hypothetical protein